MTSPSPEPSTAELAAEAIARIIDPSSWRVFDGYLADVKRKYKDQNAAYDPEAFKDKASMAKAREIIALTQPAGGAPDGGNASPAPLTTRQKQIGQYILQAWSDEPGAYDIACKVYEAMRTNAPPPPPRQWSDARKSALLDWSLDNAKKSEGASHAEAFNAGWSAALSAMGQGSGGEECGIMAQPPQA